MQKTNTKTPMLAGRGRPLLKFVLLVLAVLSACAREREEGDTPPPDGTLVDTAAGTRDGVSGPSRPDTAGWTIGSRAQPGDSMATLLEVRSARHDGFERIVYTFGPEGIPGYKVEYVDRPVRQCGSGEVVELPGDAWLMVRLEPAQAHTEEGAPTVVDRDRPLGYENIKRLKMICDFEGVVEWIVAVANPGGYRILELREPARVVLDVKK